MMILKTMLQKALNKDHFYCTRSYLHDKNNLLNLQYDIDFILHGYISLIYHICNHVWSIRYKKIIIILSLKPELSV